MKNLAQWLVWPLALMKKFVERINASTSSYTTESNEDTFKPDTVFESFHHQARILISDRALLVGFLIL